VFLF